MRNVAEDLKAEVDVALPRLSAIAEEVAATSRGTGRWSKKEILGHLVDSAANNHQRFVRAQLAEALVFPTYEQEAWVSRQAYAERPWPELIALWEALNRHLTHVIARIDPAARSRPCTIGDHAPVSLEFVAKDYVRHLRHHLGQILS